MINMINMIPCFKQQFAQKGLKTGDMLIMLIIFLLWGLRQGGGLVPPPPRD